MLLQGLLRGFLWGFGGFGMQPRAVPGFAAQAAGAGFRISCIDVFRLVASSAGLCACRFLTNLMLVSW